MCNASNEKWQTTSDWRKGTTKSRQDLNARRKGNLQIWNMKVTIILIASGTFGTVTKGLLKGLEYLEGGGRV